jgi:hypothetical protein
VPDRAVRPLVRPARVDVRVWLPERVRAG